MTRSDITPSGRTLPLHDRWGRLYTVLTLVPPDAELAVEPSSPFATEQEVWDPRYVDALISRDVINGATTAATTAGTLDPSFNGTGKATLDITANDYGRRVIVQPDGKTIVAGWAGYNAGLYRFNANGSFDYLQTVTVGSNTSSDQWKAVAFDGNRLYLAGSSDQWANVLLGKYVAGVDLDATYVQQDANYDVTGITDAKGNVLERYRYTAYGERTVLTADGTAAASGNYSRYGMQMGHQGGRVDVYTGLILFNAGGHGRFYLPSLGRWASRDRGGYIDGFNQYTYERQSPSSFLDSSGLKSENYDGPVAAIIGWLEMVKGQTMMNVTTNAEPPASFTNSDQYLLWERRKDYRDIMSVHGSIDYCSGKIKAFYPTADQKVGYTKVFRGLDGEGFQGDGKLTEQKDIASDRRSATFIVTACFRINDVENFAGAAMYAGKNAGFLPHMVGWAWSKIVYTISLGADDKPITNVAFSGSSVPSRAHYIGGQLVGGYSMAKDPGSLDKFLDTPYDNLGW